MGSRLATSGLPSAPLRDSQARSRAHPLVSPSAGIWAKPWSSSMVVRVAHRQLLLRVVRCAVRTRPWILPAPAVDRQQS